MDPLIFITRLVVLAVFLCVGLFLFITAQKGRQCAYYDPYPYGDCLSEHKVYARSTFYLALIAVVTTEGYVRLSGGSQAGVFLFIHLALALPFLTTLALMVFKYTGLRNRHIHKTLAYSCLVLYIGTILTGFSLLFPEVIANISTALNYCWPHKWFAPVK